MADETGGAPTKSGRKATKPEAATEATAPVPATTVGDSSADDSNELVKGSWSEQIAPLKAQAEKAVKTASEKLGAVDWKSHVDPIKEQAGKTAMSAAVVAKDKTGSAMQSLAKLITETAGTVDAKLGPQYGDYARQAAEHVAGAADSLDEKDVDQLLAEAKDFVRKSPAVAIGAAAVVGFVLMRLAKGSGDDA